MISKATILAATGFVVLIVTLPSTLASNDAVRAYERDATAMQASEGVPVARSGFEPVGAYKTPVFVATKATWYGPGFYGNTFACAGKRAPDGTILPTKYGKNTRGVAVNARFAACGQRFTIRKWGRIIKVRVIDRCPGCNTSSHAFDLTARSMMDLCKCSQPYTMRVKYRRGW